MFRFDRRRASTPLWGVASCSPPNRWPHPIPAIPPYVVKRPHFHRAPTTEETSFVKPLYKCLKRQKFGKKRRRTQFFKKNKNGKLGKWKNKKWKTWKRRIKGKEASKEVPPETAQKMFFLWVLRNREAVEAKNNQASHLWFFRLRKNKRKRKKSKKNKENEHKEGKLKKIKKKNNKN